MIDYSRDLIKLKDKKKNGKTRNWRGPKIASRILHRSHMRIGNESKAANIYNCGTMLRFIVDPNDMSKKKLQNAYFCQDILCHTCAKRRADKLTGQVKKIVDYVQDKGYRYIFLTLTVKNVKDTELKTTITKIMEGFNRMTKRKKFKAMSKGLMRSLEVTINWEKYEYHPHMHVLIAVDKKYFDEYENYIKHSEWVKLWRSCMRIDYDPNVDIRKVKRDEERSKKGDITYVGAIAEMTKYTGKPENYLWTFSKRDRERYEEESNGQALESKEHAEKLTDMAVGTLSRALYRRRRVAFGGFMKEVHNVLNLEDTETAELIDLDGKDETEIESDIVGVYKFVPSVKDYVLVEELSDPKYVKYMQETESQESRGDP